MSKIKMWICMWNDRTNEKFRKEVEGFPCEILKVPLLVHKDVVVGRSGWKITDPFTGYGVSYKNKATRKAVIADTVIRAESLVLSFGKSFPEIVAEKREELGNVTQYPTERSRSETEKPMST